MATVPTEVDSIGVPPPPPMAHTRPRKFMDFIWDADTHLKSAAEKKLLFKIDMLILIPICLSWWMKYIDQSNLANAYVSGMQEDLSIKANEYTYMGVLYNIAVCICTIPGSMAITKIRPSYFLAGCELGWAAFTFAQAGAKTVPQMYAFRFLVGVFESPFQTSAVFVIASWYTPSELAKRVALYFIAGPCGSAFSGFMQAAIYSTLNGACGLAGWRWLYIICGCMTVPVGLGLLFLLPDYPDNCRSPFITVEERAMAKARCSKAGIKKSTGKFTDRAFLKKVFGSWRWYTLVFFYLIYALGVQDANYFAIWLKAKKFSVDDRNLLSAAMYLITIPACCSYAWISDLTGSRLWLCVVPLCLANIPLGIIAICAGTTTKQGILMVEMAFVFCEIVLITHIFYTWIAEICRDDAEERAFIMGTLNALFNACNAWLSIVIFKQTYGPRFKRGFFTTWIFIIICIPGFFFIDYMHKRQLRQEAAAGAVVGTHYLGEEVGLESDDKKIAA
ncbi:hypothetical protein MNV49_001255 [Pseudohyphozyma bogoriensis]|nr:hypothetical protein MNV49_001255 [Pseudohyphozyma bogoriensis]